MQIRNHLHRLTAVFLICDLFDIRFQDIVIDHGNIIPVLQRILKDRDQRTIDLHSSHLSGSLRKILGHSSDTRTDLQYKIILRDTRRLNDLFQNMLVDQKILTKPFLENKMILLKDFNGIFRISKIRCGHIFSSH